MKCIELIVMIMASVHLVMSVKEQYKSHKKQVENGMGMSLLTHFLTSDSTNKLKDSGGLFDDTGCDGLDNESPLPEGTEGRYRQKARSAAAMYMKNNNKEDYSSYGCTADQTERAIEKVQWKSYVVLMMNRLGQHLLLKCCVSTNEGNIAFVISNEELCAAKITYAQEYYRSKEQFDQSLNNGMSKEQQIEQIQQQILSKRNSKKEQTQNIQKDQKDQKELNIQKEQKTKTQNIQQTPQQPQQKEQETQSEQDEALIQKQMEDLNKKLNDIKKKKQQKQQEEENERKAKEQQQKSQHETQTKYVSENQKVEQHGKIIEETRFNQVQSQEFQTNLEKTTKLENEVSSLKSDLSQIKELLMASMKNNNNNNNNSNQQSDRKQKSNNSRRRMRFKELEDVKPSRNDDDSLAQDIANMVERDVYDDKIANAKNQPKKL